MNKFDIFLYVNKINFLSETIECQRDLESIFSGLKKREAWSLTFLDSSTKLPNGILTGNFIDLGNYDECLKIKFPEQNTVGQHCLASLTFTNATRTNDTLQVLPSFLWSYCIPSSCTSRDLESLLNATVGSSFGIQTAVSPHDCHTSLDTNNLDASVIFGILFCALFGLICFASTLYDWWTKAKKAQNSRHFLRAFSIIQNGSRLLNTRGGPQDNIPQLHGLKFLSMAWIILGHRYFLMSTAPIMNLQDVQAKIPMLSFQLIAAGELAVDTFFLLSGLLNAYFLMKILDSKKLFPWSKYYLHRYVRTTPALAVMILIYATWFVHMGNGPLWNRSIRPWQQMCQDNWWVNLLYINNYYRSTSQCTGQSWYLAVDMQLYWIAPLIIIPCWRYPKWSKIYLPLLITLSAAAPFAVAYIWKFRMPFTISQNLEDYVKLTQYLMVPTHTRATPYIIGITLGMLLHHLRKSNREPSMTKWKVLLGWLFSACFCLSAVLGNHPFIQPENIHPYNRLESSFYIALYRVAWSAGISWVVFACLYGYGGPVNSLLSWKGFIPLSRLTYCLFLTHLSIQQYQLGSLRTSSYYSDFDQVHRFFSDLAMSLLASAALSLMFESPFMLLEKEIWSKREIVGHINEGFEENYKKETI